MDTAAERGLADMPRPLYGPAVALHDDKLYVVGGTSGYTYFMDVHVLDLTHRRWQVGRHQQQHSDSKWPSVIMRCISCMTFPVPLQTDRTGASERAHGALQTRNLLL